MDPELLLGSGSRKIQSWIRIWNNSFRIHNTGVVEPTGAGFFLLEPGLVKNENEPAPGCCCVT